MNILHGMKITISLVISTLFLAGCIGLVSTEPVPPKTYQGNYVYTPLTSTNLSTYTDVSGDLTVQLTVLPYLIGLSHIKSVGGDLIIKTNAALLSFESLSNLETVGGNFEIYLNSALSSMKGLEKLTSVGGDLNIYLNPALLEINSLDNLISVGGDVLINSNPALRALGTAYNYDPLKGLQTVGGTINIDF